MKLPARVLVIDDEGTVRRSCERILAEEGIEVRCASRGEEGLRVLDDAGLEAVILDMKMPGLDGLSVLRTIRDARPGLPVLVITGYATLDMKRECLGTGASAWLAKPFGPDELLDALRRAMEA